MSIDLNTATVAFRSFLLSVVEHIISLYDNAPNHELRNYCVRVGDEELTHVYPNFPLWRERALYNIDCSRQDVKSEKDSCQKDFPSHATLTPGLYLMTCGCSYKSIYGSSLLIVGESPKMLFDRSEEDYSPQIIYLSPINLFMFILALTLEPSHENGGHKIFSGPERA